jgi:hypothetical protein
VSRELILVLVLGGVVVFFALIILHVNRIERRAVDAARRLLPNYAADSKGVGHRFTGKVDGIEVTLRLYQTFSESPEGGPWSEVLFPQPPGVFLELRPQDAVETHLVTSGLAQDRLVGDPAFDQVFVVEMAPASLAPAVFDADLRGRLIELRPVRILAQEGGGLRLVKRQWDETRFAALIEAGALLASRLRQVAGAEAAQAERWGSSHTTQRAAEHAELEKVRSARASWTIRNVLLVAGGLLVILVLSLLLR